MRLIVLPTPHLQTATSALVNNPTQALIFYGASRFEAPRIGLTFRRRGMTFQILAIRAERTRSLDFARSWKFTAECQILPPSDY
jgi:hypothetical protein